MKRNSVILHLMGPAGVGKLTVAHLLATALSGRVVDNHWINNPIFGLLETDRVTPYPEAVWEQIAKVRDAVLATIGSLSNPATPYILTNELYDNDQEDRAIAAAVAAAAQRRGGLYIPIRMTCSPIELEKRVVSPERAARLKSMDAASAAKNSARTVLCTGSVYELSLETSDMSPTEVAIVILAHVSSVAGTA